MWFGDLVTMRWWDDLWLNESFATWAAAVSEAENTRWTGAWTTFSQVEKAWAYRQDQLPSTHPIAADIPDIAAVEVNFDGITYAKGAAVLKQLVAYVGREAFVAGVRAYFAAHAWGNATLADLLGSLEQTSGRDLTSWSKAWLETAGVNTLRPRFETGPDGRFTSFSVLQEAVADYPQLRPHRIAIGLYDRGGGGFTRTRQVEVDIAGGATEISELTGARRPDLILVNDDDLSYAKVRLDEQSLRALIDGRGQFADALPAAICWAAAWDMVRDGELAVRDYLDLVLAGTGTITDVTVLQTVLRQVSVAVRRFADPGWRPAGMARLAAGLRGLLEAAAAGSDEQLAFAIAFANLATGSADLTLLAGLLDGSVAIDGLVIDTDMRWRLLHRLVSRGAAGEPQIEAELDRDLTDAGQRHAASARAAIPAPEAKAAAWQQITSGQLPSATFRSTLSGFHDLDQDELLEPFAGPFFDVIGGIWQDWGSDMAQYFAEVAYPSTVITPAAIEAADAYLQRSSAPAALARLLSEGRDDVARALRCRQRDAAAASPRPRPPPRGPAAGPAGPRSGPAGPRRRPAGSASWGTRCWCRGCSGCASRRPRRPARRRAAEPGSGPGTGTTRRSAARCRQRRRRRPGGRVGGQQPRRLERRPPACDQRRRASSFLLLGRGQQAQPGPDAHLVPGGEAGDRRHVVRADRGHAVRSPLARRQRRAVGPLGEPEHHGAQHAVVRQVGPDPGGDGAQVLADGQGAGGAGLAARAATEAAWS